MGIFFYIDDNLINFDDPTVMVKDEYRNYFGRKEQAPFILSEICALDMIYSVAQMSDGYYNDSLILKGGLSVRNHVPLIDHRFSFDADYNPNTQKGLTYGDVSEIRNDIMKYGSVRRCETRAEVTKDDVRLYFIEIGYWDALKDNGYRIVERPKIEICKTCRVFTEPVKSQMNTIIDLDILGLKPPVIYHVDLEEQFTTKLFIIGSSGRQRNHFDAYDAQRIVKNNKMNWKLTKKLFDTLVERRKSKPSVYIEECRHQLDAMLKNSGKRTDLENTVFRRGSFDFDAMVQEVKSLYDFRSP
ncbi:MAG: nucleotidyl transferase AbiEii/AbiGii toxin family protein [Thaumarchaeota archaeon]|nr:nucleotidyl transferase AbiEii/AbiGii toxin family protein [Nitrososphaerota archaeon]